MPDWVQEGKRVQNDGCDQHHLLQSLNQILHGNDVLADAEVETVLHGQKGERRQGRERGSVHVVKEEEGKKWGRKERVRHKVNEQAIFEQH